MINDTDGSIHYSKDWKKELITGGEFYQGNVTVTNSENEYFDIVSQGQASIVLSEFYETHKPWLTSTSIKTI